MNLLFLTHAKLSRRAYGDGSTRYRCFNVAEIAVNRGHTAQVIEVDKLELSQLPAIDLISWLRPLPDAKALAVIKRVAELKIPCIADLDDLIFIPELARESPAVVNGFTSAGKVATRFAEHASILDRFDAISVSTTSLLEQVQAQFPLIPSAVISNGLSHYWLQHADRLKHGKASSTTVGYFSGTRSHDQDFLSICKPVSHWLKSKPQYRVDIVGKLEYPENELPAQQVRRTPWVDYFQLPKIIKTQCATLAPLTDSCFNNAKSHIKFLESAALGVPVISSTNPDFFRHQCTGLILADTDEQWREALHTVSDSRYQRIVSEELSCYVRNNCTASHYAQPLISAWESGALLPGDIESIEYARAA